MNDNPLDIEYSNPHLDAVALIYAQRRRDWPAVDRLLATTDLPDLVLVLGQMLQTGIRTQGFSVDEFLEMQASKTIAKGIDNSHDFGDEE